MRSSRRRQIGHDLRHERPHGRPSDYTDALVAPAIRFESSPRGLNARLEIAHGANAVLALLEVAIPRCRWQRHVGLQIEIVGPVAPRRTAIGDGTRREVTHGRERRPALFARGLAAEGMLAEFGQRYRYPGYRPDRGPAT